MVCGLACCMGTAPAWETGTHGDRVLRLLGAESNGVLVHISQHRENPFDSALGQAKRPAGSCYPCRIKRCATRQAGRNGRHSHNRNRPPPLSAQPLTFRRPLPPSFPSHPPLSSSPLCPAPPLTPAPSHLAPLVQPRHTSAPSHRPPSPPSPLPLLSPLPPPAR